MQVRFSRMPAAQAHVILCVEGAELPPAAQAQDKASQGAIKRAIATSRFEGKAGQSVEVIGASGLSAERVLLVGLGKGTTSPARALEKAGAISVKHYLTSGVESIAILEAEACGFDLAGDVGAYGANSSARVAVGARLAATRFDDYRTKLKPNQQPTLKAVEIGATDLAAAEMAYMPLGAAIDGVSFARDLVSQPANVLYPESFAKRLEALSELGLEVQVLGEAEMAKLGMHSLLGVGQGSPKESKMVVMQWRGGAKDAAPLALVGKGVTFDTGGISLKPGDGMWDMKGDMGGAAAVSGAMMALAKRKAKANVVGLMGLVENMPDGLAQRPGDIVKSMSGQTIEVLNTDAEGRLVLCDVMWYAQETFKPKTMIDLATLTGAIVIALGHDNAGLFSNDDALSAGLMDAGNKEGEPVWRLPMGPHYDKLIDSKNADMKNITGGRAAGSITAAQFLQRFVQDGVAWAHIDIAGTAWRSDDDPTNPLWASGFGPRVLDRYIFDTLEG